MFYNSECVSKSDNSINLRFDVIFSLNRPGALLAQYKHFLSKKANNVSVPLMTTTKRILNEYLNVKSQLDGIKTKCRGMLSYLYNLSAIRRLKCALDIIKDRLFKWISKSLCYFLGA